MATHGSSSDADLPTPNKEAFQQETLPFETNIVEGFSNAFSGMTNFHPLSTSSTLPHALSPENPKEAEEVSKKIDQAKGEKLFLRSIHHLTELSDVIRDFQTAFYHHNGSENPEPNSVTAGHDVAGDDPHSERA